MQGNCKSHSINLTIAQFVKHDFKDAKPFLILKTQNLIFIHQKTYSLSLKEIYIRIEKKRYLSGKMLQNCCIHINISNNNAILS